MAKQEFLITSCSLFPFIPMELMRQHEGQILINHGKTLRQIYEEESLATVEQIYRILNDINPDTEIPGHKECALTIKKMINDSFGLNNAGDGLITDTVKGKTLEEVLNTTLSPDRVSEYTVEGLRSFLVDNKIVRNSNDVKRLIIEGVQRAYEADDEFPIHYYTEDEEMPEESRVNTRKIPSLTDELVEELKTGSGS